MLRLPEALRQPQLTYPPGQGRGRGDRGRGPVREAGQTSSGAGRDDALPPPPRVFQLRGVEYGYPAPTSTGTILFHK